MAIQAGHLKENPADPNSRETPRWGLIAAHELGHILGLGHRKGSEDIPEAVMLSKGVGGISHIRDSKRFNSAEETLMRKEIVRYE